MQILILAHNYQLEDSVFRNGMKVGKVGVVVVPRPWVEGSGYRSPS